MFASSGKHEEILNAWLNNIGENDGFPNDEETLIAFDKIMELVDMDPEEAWGLIYTARRIYKGNEIVLGQVAASVLEDLLGKFGDQFIERVEQEAINDTEFTKMLGGIYLSSLSEENREKVERVLVR